MLVVTRREGESVVVQDKLGRFKPFEVRLTSIRGDRVRIAFEADAEIVFIRKELIDAVRPIRTGTNLPGQAHP